MNKASRAGAVLLAIPAIFLSLYWVKCQSQIDIFRAFKLENYLPLDSFQWKTPIIDAAQTGLLVHDDFEASSLRGWSKLWSRTGKGSADIRRSGADGGRCAVITPPGESDWSFQREALIEVRPGQRFQYHLSFKTNRQAAAGVILYDAKKNVTEWSYGSVSLPSRTEWTRSQGSFVIPDGAAYIRFRVFGSGEGSIDVDNVSLERDGSP